MKRSWIGWNRLYINAVNSDDGEGLTRFFDDACEEDALFFIRRRYIWNILRGKEFCRILAEWVIDWYRRASTMDNGDVVMVQVTNLVHRVMATTISEKIKRSLVWKITKYAPVLTIDTIPYISEERLMNILDSDKWIVTDDSIRPFIKYCAKLRVDVDNEKVALNVVTDMIST